MSKHPPAWQFRLTPPHQRKSPSYRFGSSTAVKEEIKSGLGLSVLSAIAIDTEVKAGLLEVLKVKGLSMSLRFFLVRNKLRIASPSCRAMHNFLLLEKPLIASHFYRNFLFDISIFSMR